MPSLEDECYATATAEAAEGNFDAAAWGRAFSQALGDRQATVALYIRFRAEQLVREQRVAQIARVGKAVGQKANRLLYAAGAFCLVLLVGFILLALAVAAVERH